MSHKIERLRHQLTQVQKNRAFLLHAGDCAESFDACTHVRSIVLPSHSFVTDTSGRKTSLTRSVSSFRSP